MSAKPIKANTESEEPTLYLDPETGLFDYDTKTLTIPEIVELRYLNGLTYDPPHIPDEDLSLPVQAAKYPPVGWEAVFSYCAKEELVIIQKWLTKNCPKYYPHPRDVFRAFHLTPLHAVKVVLVGQDPYQVKGKATGLCFSIDKSKAVDASLGNIFKEISRSCPGFTPYKRGDLTHWAQQGVLMVNQALTVKPNGSNEHTKAGIWKSFMIQIFKTVIEANPKVCFVLWGNEAQKVTGKMIGERVKRFEAGHPSPLNRFGTFIGCDHFVKINEYLRSRGMEEIRW